MTGIVLKELFVNSLQTQLYSVILARIYDGTEMKAVLPARQTGILWIPQALKEVLVPRHRIL